MPDYPDGALQAGTPAPDFELHSTPDQFVSRADFKGSPLILAFYPADWSPVCTDQMALYNEILPEFQRLGAALVGISIDHAWCHVAFAQSRNCTSHCSPTFIQRAKSRRRTASTTTRSG